MIAHPIEKQIRSTYLITVVLSIIAGLVLSLLAHYLGLLLLPVGFFLIFILPWLIQDAFRLFIWLIVTWPFLTLYVRIPLPGGIPDISYDRVLALMLVCVVIAEVLRTKKQLMKISTLDILIILYIGAQLLTRLHVILFGGMGNPDLNGLLDITLVPVMLYWCVKNVIVSRSQLKWLLYAFVIASLLICLSGLYEQAIGVKVFIALGSSSDVYEWSDIVGMRATGVLGNPAIYGATMGMGILAGICCLPHIKRKFIQFAFVVIIGVLLYGVFASYTRSAWLSVLSVLFVAQFFVSGLWKRALPILMLGLLLLILLWNELPANAAIIERASNTGNIIFRLNLINLGWEKFLERPFFGWGAGALNAFALRQVTDTSHNLYLTFLVDGGLVLFLSFLAVVGYLSIRAIRVYRMTQKNSLERNFLVASIGSVLIFLLSGLALELRYFGYFNALFWIYAGIIDSGLGTKRSSEGRSLS